MMRFDLDSLDPLTPLPAPKTAADLEVESWQETMKFRYRKMLDSAPLAIREFESKTIRHVGINMPIKMAGRMNGPADISSPAFVSVDMGRPEGDQTVVTMWGRRNGKATLIKALEAHLCLTCKHNLANSHACHTCGKSYPNWAPK